MFGATHAASLEAIAGQTPVAAESGKKKVACFRWTCNKNLRDAVSARAGGHDHPHAIRILGPAWLRVTWRIWQDRTTHDPSRHRNLDRLITTQG